MPWVTNTQGTSEFRAVSYGNGYWVAVGVSGTLYYTTDPTGSWTSNPQGTVNLTDVSYGNGYWMTVGTLNGVAYYKATDPTGAWTSITEFVSGGHESCRYGNGYWVAAISQDPQGVHYRQNDPTGSWTQQATTSVGTSRGVFYGNGYWVSVTKGITSPRLSYRAANPAGTWTSNDQGVSFDYAVYGGGYWVAVGEAGGLVYRATDPTGAWTSNAQGSAEHYSVAYSPDDLFYATAPFAGLNHYYTRDPSRSAWTQKAIPNVVFNDIAYGNGYWVMVGASGTIIYHAQPLEQLQTDATETVRLVSSPMRW